MLLRLTLTWTRCVPRGTSKCIARVGPTISVTRVTDSDPNEAGTRLPRWRPPPDGAAVDAGRGGGVRSCPPLSVVTPRTPPVRAAAHTAAMDSEEPIRGRRPADATEAGSPFTCPLAAVPVILVSDANCAAVHDAIGNCRKGRKLTSWDASPSAF